jgi:hypothetical protein
MVVVTLSSQINPLTAYDRGIKRPLIGKKIRSRISKKMGMPGNA